MAEVKSALEIALERATALGAGEDDSRREAAEKGRALARRLLEGEAEPEALAGMEAGPARQSAAETLARALSGDKRLAALAGLKALAGEGAAEKAWDALASAADAREAALIQVMRQLAAEQAASLAAVGIAGPAAKPNPEAHPDYEKRVAAALAKAGEALQAAGKELLAALAQRGT